MSQDLFKAYELYLADRTRLATAKLESAKSYDQTILTLSGGAVALSITFLEKLVHRPSVVWLLYASWICFGVAMLCTLYSLLASQRAVHEEIRKLDRSYQALVGVDGQESAKPPEEREKTRFGLSTKWVSAFAKIFMTTESLFGRAVRWLNRLAGLFFFAGVVIFATFAMENWTRIEPGEQNEAVTTPVTAAAVIRPAKQLKSGASASQSAGDTRPH
jgi:hypothetical protein